MSIEKIVTQLIRPEIRALKAYHVPDASGLIKLDAMENPYAWPAALKPGRVSRQSFRLPTLC